MAADEHIEDDAVDLVVGTVVGDRPDGRRDLPESVYPALPLFVSGRVPRQVVVQDGGKPVLQVDAFGEAVGCDQHPGPIMISEVPDARFAFLGRKVAGHGLRPRGRVGFGEGSGEVLGEVVGGWDVAAEDDRVIAACDKGIDDRDGAFEFGVAFHAPQCCCIAGEGTQATSRVGVCILVAGGVGAEGGVHLRRCHRG